MKVALVVIATGENYRPLLDPLLESARSFFPAHEAVVFTDDADVHAPIQKRIGDLGFPLATLFRYHIILAERETLERFDQIFYCDVDMRFVSPIAGDDIFSDGITAVLHPGWANPVASPFGYEPKRPFEDRSESEAFVEDADSYFAGAFVGGGKFIEMAEAIRSAIDGDLPRGIVGRWNDESYLNRYLHDHPPAKVLSPEYCYPSKRLHYYREIWGRDYEPKLMCVEKPVPKPEAEPVAPALLSPQEKHALIISSGQESGFRILVETGTCGGDTIAATIKHFDQVHSIELSTKHYQRAVRRFRDVHGVRLYHGNSSDVLPDILAKLHEPAVFWLDAHYSGDDTAKAENDPPIREELDAIFAHCGKAVILIDDMRGFDRESLLANIRERGDVEIEDAAPDILRVWKNQ